MDERSRQPRFDDLIGQDRAIALLRAAVEHARVHHAWIFCGPAGVGKRTAADAFASLLLDPDAGPDLAGVWDVDPSSETQRLLASGGHPDFHVITKELAAYSEKQTVRNQKQITIAKDVIEKRLLEPIALAPTMSSHGRASKVFVIDEADLMDRHVSNAPSQTSLLKTLEEPPEGSVIVLVTAHEERLVPTVRSRCQRVAFRALADDEMEVWRRRSGLELSDADWAWVALFANGSPGQALLAVETGLIEWARTLEPMLDDITRGRFPVSGGAELAALLDGWASAWVTRGEKAGAKPSKDAANRMAMRHLVSLLASWARRRIREGAHLGADELDRRARAVDAIAEAEAKVQAAVQPIFALDDLLARLSLG